MNDGGILGFKWLEDPSLFSLDCGNSSCRYAFKRGGMRTNGGCSCVEGIRGLSVERFLLRNIAKLHQENQRLQADIEMEKLLYVDAK